MFQITEKMISSLTNNPMFYQRGVLYFFKGAVSNFIWDEKHKSIYADVLGSRKYNVTIDFSSAGNIINTYCTCPVAHSYTGVCKHIVATIKYAQSEYERELNSKQQREGVIENIFKYFQNTIDNSQKKALNLDLTYECEYLDDDTTKSSISLKIGENKLYIVKSVKELISAIDNGEDISYGKAFTFNPAIHKFYSQDENIISFIKELSDIESISVASSYSRGSIFNGKKVYISNYSVARLFGILEGKKITVIIDSTLYKDVDIVSQNLPIKFKLDDLDNKRFSLEIENSDKYIPLTIDSSCFFYDDKIYKLDKAQQKYLLPFFDIFRQRLKSINFKSSQKEQFVSEVLPAIQQNSNIEVSAEIQNNIVKEEIRPKIYLDMVDNILTANIKFQYGIYEINPFNPEENVRQDNKILMRNTAKENFIMTIFENSNFLVNKDYLYMESDDQIFGFIYETLPSLQESAEIYYSDSFNKIKFAENRKFAVGIKLSGSTLEMSIDYGNIEPSELKDIFYSFRVKKKYHKLKNGAFVPLDNESFEDLSDILEYMDVSDKTLSNKVIPLSTNRAMYLDSQLSQKAGIEFDKSDDFNTLVNNIMQPINMDFTPPESLATLLRSYQIVGFKWLKTLAYYGLGGILADDMGLGKTLQTIAFILSEHSDKSSIVVCPTSLVYNWLDEINKFAPELKVVIVSGTQTTRQELLQDIENKDLIRSDMHTRDFSRELVSQIVST